MQLTNQEIQFIKDLYANSKTIENIVSLDAEVEQALKVVTDKYEPLLNTEDLELRKELIEQQAQEASEIEEKIRNK